MIPCSDPHAQYLEYKSEIDQAIHKVLDSGWYILGDEVAAFEAEFAAYVGAQYAIGVGSGTEALHIALTACGIGPGDEVITVSHTAVATVAAIGLCGATPVFVDIDRQTYTMDVALVSAAITEKTKAIIAVHLYGNPVSVQELGSVVADNGLYLIEDCAQAHGALLGNQMVGSLGDIGCFSFYPTKNLGAMGDGGAITTSNTALAEKVRLIREYGWKQRFVSETPGWNSRLDEVQAAILRVKLRYLDLASKARRTLATKYFSGLAGLNLGLPVTTDGGKHVYHLFVVRSKKRDALLAHLKSNEIGVAIHYPVPVHKQPAYRSGIQSLPETENACAEILSLPMYPQLSNRIERVIEVIRSFEERR